MSGIDESVQSRKSGYNISEDLSKTGVIGSYSVLEIDRQYGTQSLREGKCCSRKETANMACLALERERTESKKILRRR